MVDDNALNLAPSRTRKNTPKPIKKRGPYVLKEFFNNESINISKEKPKSLKQTSLKKTLQNFNKIYFGPTTLPNITNTNNNNNITNKENRSSNCEENNITKELINLDLDKVVTETSKSNDTKISDINNEPNEIDNELTNEEEKQSKEDFNKYTYLINYLDNNYNPKYNLEQEISLIDNELINKSKKSIETLIIRDTIDVEAINDASKENINKCNKKVVFKQDIVCMTPELSQEIIKVKKPRKANAKLPKESNKKRIIQANRSKKDIINILREQLKLQISFEPQNMFESLKLLAQSKFVK